LVKKRQREVANKLATNDSGLRYQYGKIPFWLHPNRTDYWSIVVG